MQSYYQDKEENLVVLKEMYANFPFFRTLIDTVQMAVAKADLVIAKEYSSHDFKTKEARDRIYGQIEDRISSSQKS